GCEVAEFLAGRAIRPFTKGSIAVTVIEMKDCLADGIDFGTKAHHADLLGELGVNVYLSTTVKEITDDGLVLDVNGEEKVLTGMDNIVLAMGSKPYDTLSEKLKGIVPEVYVIGDAKEAHSAMEATNEGAKVGRLV
ncbi:MAG: NADH-dependent flavin oxidoreductase, partial [Firmicutes bacterium HGW-Firmicutes-12]